MKKIVAFLLSRELWIGVAGSLIATVIAAFFNKVSFEGFNELFSKDFLLAILRQPIPMYVLLIAILIFSVIIFVARRKNKPKFLAQTTMQMGGLTWHWNWQYNKSKAVYEIVDFVPLCPQCGQELRMGYGEHTYSCMNKHHYNILRYFEQKAQIMSTLRSQYADDSDKME